jgi:hypothetical protein
MIPKGRPASRCKKYLTPWAGAFERINAYSYFAWLFVLALERCDEGVTF